MLFPLSSSSSSISHCPGSGEGAPSLEGLIRDYIALVQPPLGPQWRTLTSSSVTLHNSDADNVITVPWLGAQQAQQVLVQMSYIRWMCRMLADCNDGGTMGKAGEEERLNQTFVGAMAKESRSRGEVSDGITAMGKCWGVVVYSEVAQVLGRLAEWDSPYSVAVEIVRLYNQLKQGMLELFGGRSHFALAMKEGFSKAFLGLDEVEGVKVCDCATQSMFLHYILDGAISTYLYVYC